MSLLDNHQLKVVSTNYNIMVSDENDVNPGEHPDPRHVQSNHPPNIIKQLPKTIEQRLSNNSSNETIFNEAAPLYEKALSEAGDNVKLK